MIDENLRVVARSEELLAKEIGLEIVVYDLLTDEAHLLSPPCAAAWRLAKDPISIDDLRTAIEGTGHGATAQSAIGQLVATGLLRHAAPAGISRRTLMKAAAASAVTVPLLTTILAPTPAAAAAPSVCTQAAGGPCSPTPASPAQCCGTGQGTCTQPPGYPRTCRRPNGAACTASNQCQSTCCSLLFPNTCREPVLGFCTRPRG